jgi:primosomal protein N' (replication factor Y)
MLKRYADIIIDISHEAIDRTFQYIIPEALADKIIPGIQVNIPFGRGNNLRKGYVTDVTDEPSYDVDKMKYIDSVCDTALPVESKLIALAFWMKENYGSTMINAFKTVMPVKQAVRMVVERTVYLKAGSDELENLKAAYERKHANAKLRLLSELTEVDYLPMDIVSGKLNISQQTLKALEKDGVIEIAEKKTYRDVGSFKIKNKPDIQLNAEQQSIVDEFENDINENIHRTYLLHGITGSGKTEIYVRTIQKVIEKGKQAILLIPEIALTYQIVKYFRSYFGDRVTFINSRLSKGEKYDQFMKAKNGQVDIVIGPRSALFVPFKNLGLIIIDEEHENSYKSENPPKYHAREVAAKRAEIEAASLILGSATPSVESYKKACDGVYRLWRLTKRARSTSLATTSIVDLRQELRRGNRSIISGELEADIRDRLEKQQQIMLFINKRGYNNFVSCRSCGEAIKCPHCDVSLAKHNGNVLMCHYCGYKINQPDICPNCKSRLIGGYGTGTQKVEEEVKRLFPEARILRMDKDTTTKKNSHEIILDKFSNGEADILIGTQMIVKGHDFSNVTLVGIILADLTLFNNDYKASERTFDLLTQAAGRAGRGELPGKVVIQTYKPEHYAITSAASQNYNTFYDSEEAYRKLMKYPPECNMLVILMISAREQELDKKAVEIGELIKNTYKADRRMMVIGPSVPVISKIKDIYRRVVYVKNFEYNRLIEVKNQIEKYMCDQENNEVSIQFDFNPGNMY